MYQFKNERLKTIRELNGLTQEDAGRKIGSTGPHWNKLEKGEIDPSVTTLLKILNTFPPLHPNFLFVWADAFKQQEETANEQS